MPDTLLHIAVDGPVAAGKGTVSRLVADRLGVLYVDTGAMYRAAALLAHRQGIAPDDEVALVPLVESADISLSIPEESERDGRLITVLLNGEDVSWLIRTEEISNLTSKISLLPKVRAVMVSKQQAMAEKQSVVMEGRDITYRVLPNARLKIYLTASDVVRAKRRHLQLQTKGEDVSFQQVHEELIKRDYADSHREHDPLTIIPEAWVIDASDLAIEQVVEAIVNRAKAHLT